MRKPNADNASSNPQKVVILGGGESGVGAATLGIKHGNEVFVSDFGIIKDAFQKELQQLNISFEEKQHTESRILDADVVVKSPGIPDKAPIIKKIKAKGIPIISEIEWAFRFLERGKIIAITGSNGKTTTTSLIYHLLKSAGLDAAIGGNIGYSFAKLVANGAHDFYVLEVSSFQLDDIECFRPDIAIILNITADHLDRYEYDINQYAAAKFNLVKNQGKEDYFILNGNDTLLDGLLSETAIKPSVFKVYPENIKDNGLTINDYKIREEALSIKGPHNLFNAGCAVAVAQKLGVENETIQEALKTFVNVPHRMEVVAEINGISYINDSKATNIDAVFFALKAMEKPVIWIVGGTDKGNDYEPLMELVEEKVKAIICLGVDNTKILEAFSTTIKIIEEINSAQQAVHVASTYAEQGDVVLLSPACASFDRFVNYEARGDQFREAVLRLRD